MQTEYIRITYLGLCFSCSVDAGVIVDDFQRNVYCDILRDEGKLSGASHRTDFVVNEQRP